MIGDELSQRPLQPAIGNRFGIRQDGREASGEDGEGAFSVARQRRGEGVGKLLYPGIEFQRVQAGGGLEAKGLGVEGRPCRAELIGEAGRGLGVKILFEGFAFFRAFLVHSGQIS